MQEGGDINDLSATDPPLTEQKDEETPMNNEVKDSEASSTAVGGGSTRGMGDLLAMLRQQKATTEPVVSSQVIEDSTPTPLDGTVGTPATDVDRQLSDSSTAEDNQDSSTLPDGQPASKPFTPTYDKEVRRERKMASGMAAILQQLRGSCTEESSTTPTLSEPNDEAEKSDVAEKRDVVTTTPSDDPVANTLTSEETFENIDLSKLNRKERRALLQKQREAAGESETQEPAEQVVCEEPVAKVARFKVPFNLWETPAEKVFTESEMFVTDTQTFGFSASVCANNYVKLAKFSPCGSYLASTSQDRKARIFKLDEQASALSLCSTVSLGDLPYDAVWHPCGDLLATSSKHHPIHLWNTEGTREASYRGINHLDELAAAYTMAFSADGLKMYAGYNKCIRIWDVRRPGRQTREIKTWKTKPYKQGQKAIVSSIAMHPFYEGVYAVGTYGSSIGLYSDRTNFIECQFGGDFSSITHLKYSSDGMKLFSCGRKNNSIHCWDMRNPGKLLLAMSRPFDTNQKIYFDMDGADRFLFSGTSDGRIVVFDLQEGEEVREPKHVTEMAQCAVPCVSVHPRLPLVAACTGERVFPYPSIFEENEPDQKTCQPEDTAHRPYLDGCKESQLQNCIQLWKY